MRHIHGHIHGNHCYYTDSCVNYLDVYYGLYKGKPISLQEIQDRWKALTKQNYLASDSNKLIKANKKYIDIYRRSIKKFFKDNKELKTLSTKEIYESQKEYCMKLYNYLNDSSFLLTEAFEIRNEDAYENFLYVKENITPKIKMKDYRHFILMNKDNNIVIDVFCEMIGLEDPIYTNKFLKDYINEKFFKLYYTDGSTLVSNQDDYWNN
jgi:hypothetical protein